MRLLACLVPAVFFAGAAAAQQRPDELTVQLMVAADTILILPTEAYRITARTSRPARVTATVSRAVWPGEEVWRSDTIGPTSVAALAWDLRAPGGEPVGEGRYVVSVVAGDAAGGAARARAVVAIIRLPPDTVSIPPPLAASELAPESLMVGRTEPWAIPIGLAAILAPGLLGRSEFQGTRHVEATQWIAAGGVLGLGLVSFLTGRHPEFSAENAQHNAEARARHAERVAVVTAANRAAREQVMYRVTREGSGP